MDLKLINEKDKENNAAFSAHVVWTDKRII